MANLDALSASRAKQTARGFTEPVTPASAPAATPAVNTGGRDYALESAKMNEMGLDGSQLDPQMERDLFEATYSPDKLANITDYKSLVAGQSKLAGSAFDNMNKAKSAYLNFKPGQMMGVLEDALRTKTDVGNQPIGTSSLFEKAGIPNTGVAGFTTLMQSLNQNSKDMRDRYGSFTNVLDKAGTFVGEENKKLAESAKLAIAEFDNERTRLDGMIQNVVQHQQAMDLAEQQFDLFKKQQDYVRSLQPTADDIANWRVKGYEYVNGEYVPADSFQAVFGSVGNPSDAQFDQCGYFSNRATNADNIGKHVGDSWESKIRTADTIVRKGPSGLTQPDSFSFQPGNTLYIPMGQYGHTAVITSYDPVSGNINVVERNKNLDGQTTSGMYNVLDLQNQYPEWGVAKTSFAPALQQQMAATQGESAGLFSDFASTLPAEKAQIFNALPAEDQSNIKQLLEGDALLSDLFTARGVEGQNARQKAVLEAQKIDPTFSENTNKERYNYKKQFNAPNSRAQISIGGLNTAMGHLAELKLDADQLNNTNLRKYNSLSNLLKKELSDPTVAKFDYTLNLLATEIATAYKGGVPDQAEVSRNYDALSKDLSPEAIDQVFTRAATLMASKMASIGEQFKGVMGRYPDPDVVIQSGMVEQLRASGIDTGAIEGIVAKQGGSASSVQFKGGSVTVPADIMNSGLSGPAQTVAAALGFNVKQALSDGNSIKEIEAYLLNPNTLKQLS